MFIKLMKRSQMFNLKMVDNRSLSLEVVCLDRSWLWGWKDQKVVVEKYHGSDSLHNYVGSMIKKGWIRNGINLAHVVSFSVMNNEKTELHAVEVWNKYFWRGWVKDHRERIGENAVSASE